MHMRRFVCFLVLTVVWMPSAHAVSVALTFTSFLPPNPLFGDIGEPVPVVANYVIDPSIPDDDPSGIRGDYPFAVTGGSVWIGDVEYTVVPDVFTSQVIVVNDSDFGDVLYVSAAIRSDAGDGGGLEVTLLRSDATILSSDDIPLFDLDLADFDPFDPAATLRTVMYAAFVDGYPAFVPTEIQSLQYRVVPLPGREHAGQGDVGERAVVGDVLHEPAAPGVELLEDGVVYAVEVQRGHAQVFAQLAVERGGRGDPPATRSD